MYLLFLDFCIFLLVFFYYRHNICAFSLKTTVCFGVHPMKMYVHVHYYWKQVLVCFGVHPTDMFVCMSMCTFMTSEYFLMHNLWRDVQMFLCTLIEDNYMYVLMNILWGVYAYIYCHYRQVYVGFDKHPMKMYAYSCVISIKTKCMYALVYIPWKRVCVHLHALSLETSVCMF